MFCHGFPLVTTSGAYPGCCSSEGPSESLILAPCSKVEECHSHSPLPVNLAPHEVFFPATPACTKWGTSLIYLYYLFSFLSLSSFSLFLLYSFFFFGAPLVTPRVQGSKAPQDMNIRAKQIFFHNSISSEGYPWHCRMHNSRKFGQRSRKWLSTQLYLSNDQLGHRVKANKT